MLAKRSWPVQPENALPYRMMIHVCNKHSSLALKLDQFFATGSTSNIAKDEMLNPGETKAIEFTLYAENLHHAICLEYILLADSPFVVKITSQLSIGTGPGDQKTEI